MSVGNLWLELIHLNVFMNSSSPFSKTPFFSILVPTYNQSQYLPEALDSLLQQTYPNWEALVVNDGSTDHTEEVMKSYALQDSRIRTFSKENGGVSTALNVGIRNARGEWICWLSSDDLFEKDKLQTHLSYMREYPQFRFHFTRFRELDEESNELSEPQYKPPGLKYRTVVFLYGNIVHGISIAAHRSVFEEIGLFDEKLRYAQDFDMWLRIHSKYESLFIEKETCTTRIHSGQGTHSFFDACSFDAAWACNNFLEASSFSDIFPFLSLRNPYYLVKAVRKAIRTLACPEAYMNRAGFNSTLALRLERWIRQECPIYLRPLARLAIVFEVQKYKRTDLPNETKNTLRRLKYLGIQYGERKNYRFYDNAKNHVVRLELDGKAEEGRSLESYLDNLEKSGVVQEASRDI